MSTTTAPTAGWGVYHCPQRGPVRKRRWVLVGTAGSESAGWSLACDLKAEGSLTVGDWAVRRLAPGDANAIVVASTDAPGG